MSFTENNQLWKMRSKNGRGYFFKTPEALWEAACNYFTWCDEHPVYKSVAGGPRYEPGICIAKVRAYTLKGLCVYLGCGSKYFSHFAVQLNDKTDEESEEFKSVVEMIRDAIFEQKFTNAASGELNASIIAREMNLAYNTDLVYRAETEASEPKKERTTLILGDQEIQI